MKWQFTFDYAQWVHFLCNSTNECKNQVKAVTTLYSESISAATRNNSQVKEYAEHVAFRVSSERLNLHLGGSVVEYLLENRKLSFAVFVVFLGLFRQVPAYTSRPISCKTLSINHLVSLLFRPTACDTYNIVNCYHAANSGNFLPTFRDNPSLPSSRLSI
jgi:hypothetical protein